MLILSLNSCVFFSASYKADETATLLIETLKEQGRFRFEKPVYHMTASGDTSLPAIIFYPGAKVEPLAYVPLWERLRNEGYDVFIVDMPMDFAFLNINAAAKIMENNPGISRWIISGHSLGGAMAWEYLAREPKAFHSAILIGSYPAKSTDLSQTQIPVLSIREEKGLPGSSEKAREVEGNFPPGTRFYTISGANHAQFGNYGIQKDDSQARISWQVQQDITAEVILDFLAELY